MPLPTASPENGIDRRHVDRARVLLQRPSTQRWIDGIAGTAIVGFGLKLGFDRA